MTDRVTQALIAELKAKVQEQDEFIQSIQNQAAPLGTVAFVGADKVIVAAGGGLVEVPKSPTIDVEVGDTITFVNQTGAILGKAIASTNGPVSTVGRVISDTIIQVNAPSGAIAIFKPAGLELEKGDSVALDSTGTVVIRKVDSAAKQYVKQSTGVAWCDIGGLEDVKSQLIEAVELPRKEPEIFKYYGYAPPKGILLLGPPGCGKTMLGKAVATSLAKINGVAEEGFIYVKGPEVLDKFVGESESKIRGLFDQARAHKKVTGSPAVIFIDEAESLLSRRGTGRSSDMERTIVPAFLAEMDGLDETSAMVILATNRADQLDPAIVRDGRIDRKIEVTRPGRAGVLQIAAINLSKVPTKDVTKETLAIVIADELLSDKRVIKTVTTQFGQVTVRMRDAISGAMVSNAVSRAKSIAMARDLKDHTMTGVTQQDVIDAIDLIQIESGRVDHTDEVREILANKDKHVLTEDTNQVSAAV